MKLNPDSNFEHDTPLPSSHEATMAELRHEALTPSPYGYDTPLRFYDEPAGPGSSQRAFEELAYLGRSLFGIGPYVNVDVKYHPNGKFDRNLGCFIYRDGRTLNAKQMFESILDAERALLATRPTLLPQGVFIVWQAHLDETEHRSPEVTAKLIVQLRREAIGRVRSLRDTEIGRLNAEENS